ncbi:MAG: carbohydrate kinase family protein [archaeon]|nr:carbohydrate kinase family protein [archaeon]
MLRKYDVITVGSATVDRILTMNGSFSSVKLGDKILLDTVEKFSGGGATNSAAAFSVLGLRTAVVTKVGDDEEGDFVEREMRVDYGVKNLCQHRSHKKTDLAFIVTSLKEKDRVIFVQKGASQELRGTDFKKSSVRAKWIYLSTLIGSSFSTAKDVAEIAKRKKINLLFNPSLYLAQKGKRYLAPVLKACNILVCNLEEAQALLGIKSKDVFKLLRGIQKLGPKRVIITNSIKKLHAIDGDLLYSYVPPNAPRKHTAGAGDAFTAGFLAGIIKGKSFLESLQVGQMNATSIVQYVGTKNKLLTFVEASHQLKKYPFRITVREL